MSVNDALTVARIVCWLAMAVFVGGGAFLAILWPGGAEVRRSDQILTGAWVLGFLSGVAGLGLQAALIAGNRFSSAYDWTAIRSLVKTQFGVAWASRDLLWLLALVCLVSLKKYGEGAARALSWRVGFAVVSLGMIRAAGLVSHAPLSAHTTTGDIADFVHLVGVCLWLGGLVFLAAVLLPRARAEELALVVPRWSLVALVAVSTVIVAGIVMAYLLVGGWSGLFNTPYGHKLLIKIAAVAVLLAAAYGSKVWVEHRLRVAVVLDGDRATLRPFVLSVGAEAVVALVVLTFAGLLVAGNPGA